MTNHKRWQVQPPITPEADAALVRFPPILRQLLYNRGYSTYEDAGAFLRGQVTGDLNPFLMKGMEAAVDRIRTAIEKGEPIAVYGDYDVDGVTATALLVQTLQ